MPEHESVTRAFGRSGTVRGIVMPLGSLRKPWPSRAGVNRSYFASLEAGHRNASLETICRLAVALDCDAADLVRGTQAVAGRT
jgi:hypothetical protein